MGQQNNKNNTNPQKANSPNLLQHYYKKVIHPLFPIHMSPLLKPDFKIERVLSESKKEQSLLNYDNKEDRAVILKEGNRLMESVHTNPDSQVFEDFQDFKQLSEANTNEQLLKKNTFYILSQSIFNHFHSAAKRYFMNSMEELFSYSPKKIIPIHFRGLTVLGILTFLISMFTTGYGVNHLLQNNSIPLLTLLQGDSGEIPRFIIALLSGCSLSYIILHLKVALYRGMLATGKVFKGIKAAYLKHPVGIITACLLAFVSLKTNYDGGVALISKAEYVSEQQKLITKNALTALGKIKEKEKAEGMTSFKDSVVFLNTKVEEILKQFQKFPLDEADGNASSGHSGQGPRYFGKRFVINGRYDDKVLTVSSVSKGGTLARQIDYIISSSGLDMSLSLEEKMKGLVGKYEVAVRNQEKTVQQYIQDLNQLVDTKESVLPSFLSLAFVEYYDLNERVQQMAKSFTANANLYKETSTKLKTLINEHIKVLTAIDRSGRPKHNKYEVAISFPPMNVAGVAALQRDLPKVKYKSFSELIELLKGKYGLLWAQVIMLIILVLSVLIDLADVVFLSPNIARQGRNEAAVILGKRDELNEWEEKFLKQIYVLLHEKDIETIFGGLIPKEDALIVDAFYQLIEEINPQIIDPLDRHWTTQIKDYLLSVFKELHIPAANDYNERVVAITNMTENPEVCMNRLMEIIFPYLDEILEQGDFSFDEVDRRVQGRQGAMIEDLLTKMKRLSADNSTPSFYKLFQMNRNLKKLTKADASLTRQIKELEPEITELPEVQNQLVDYNKIRRLILEQEQCRVREEISNIIGEAIHVQSQAESFLSHGTANLNRMAIWFKMIKSFLIARYGSKKSETGGDLITSRRGWLATMGQNIHREQEI